MLAKLTVISGLTAVYIHHKRQPLYSNKQLRPQFSLRCAHLIETQSERVFSDEWFKPFVSFRPYFRSSDVNSQTNGPTKLMGSGVIITRFGYVLTHSAAVLFHTELTVRLGDGQEFRGRVVYTSPELHYSVVKLCGTRDDWPVVTAGESASVELCDTVRIIVCPKFGVYNSVVSGVVSCFKRLGTDVPGFGSAAPGVQYIQHTASIPHNAYGSALVDTGGRVLGISAMQDVVHNLNVCIPIHLVLDSVNKALAQLETGQTLGVIMYWLDEGLRARIAADSTINTDHFPDANGIVLWDFFDDKSDHWKNVHKYDVITKINGKDVKQMDDILVAMEELKCDGSVDLVLNKRGKRHTLSAIPFTYQSYVFV